jgi:hypothetical protein
MSLNFRPQGPGASGPVTGDGTEGAYQIADNAMDTFAPNDRSGGVQAAQRFLECANNGATAFNRTPGLDAATSRVLNPTAAAQHLPNLQLTGLDSSVASQAARPMAGIGSKAMSMFDASMAKAPMQMGMPGDLGSSFGGMLDASASGGFGLGFVFQFLHMLMDMMGEIGTELLHNIEAYEEATVAALEKTKL